MIIDLQLGFENAHGANRISGQILVICYVRLDNDGNTTEKSHQKPGPELVWN